MGPAGSMQPLHRVTIGRTREVRGPDGFERGAVGIIIAVVAAIAVWASAHLVHMVQTLDAVSLASSVETNAIVYRAERGHWPEPGTRSINDNHAHGVYATNLRLGQGGVITADLALGRVRFNWTADVPYRVVHATHGLLSFRPELLGAPDAPAISFLCGYAQPSPGAAVSSGTNRTTLSRQDLPPFCR